MYLNLLHLRFIKHNNLARILIYTSQIIRFHIRVSFKCLIRAMQDEYFSPKDELCMSSWYCSEVMKNGGAQLLFFRVEYPCALASRLFRFFEKVSQEIQVAAIGDA